MGLQRSKKYFESVKKSGKVDLVRFPKLSGAMEHIYRHMLALNHPKSRAKIGVCSANCCLMLFTLRSQFWLSRARHSLPFPSFKEHYTNTDYCS